jgi:cell pole-organizing protein PopZ
MSSKSAALPETRDENEPSMEEILASIRKIIADDSLGMKKDEPQKRPVARKEPEPPPPAPEPMVEDEVEVLDLAEVAKVASAPSVVVPEPEPEPEPEPIMIAEPPPARMPPPVMVAPPPPPKAPVQTVAALEERIVSENTGALVGHAFQMLARQTAMPAVGRSLEDVVAELLRPMLRDWMDHHLPSIVEKLVKAEIERVSRG